MPPSDAYVRSFLYLLYTLIKLYYTKALSNPASCPGLNSSPLEAKNPASHRSATTSHLGGSSGILQDKMGLIMYVSLLLLTPEILSLLLLTPEILSLPFDPQDNAFLSWAHSYAAFHSLTAGSVDHPPLHP